jgi:ArsR family transcriptional regulator
MRRLSDEQIDLVARRARALGDPTRVRIIDLLARAAQPVGQIAAALETQQSTISKHLQILFHAGLVERRRAASTVIYSVADAELAEWCRYIGSAHFSGRPPAR